MRSWSTAAPASLPSPSGESSAVLSLEIHWIAPRRSLRRSGVSGILALAAAFNGWRALKLLVFGLLTYSDLT